MKKIVKLNPDTSRIKNNLPNKNIELYEEFSIEKIRKISQENKEKKDSEYEKEISKMIGEFKKIVKDKIYSEASSGKFYTYISKDDFITIFGKKYNKGYYPKISKEVVAYLKEYGFYISVPCDDKIQENDKIFINWEER